MRYIIDSYAWLEYFMGTELGRRVKEIIDSEADEKLTPSICLAETYAKILKTEDEEKAELRRSFIKSRSALVLLTEELAVEAAKVDVSMKRRVQGWGLADSIVLSTARNRNGKVVTGDLHFRGLTEAHMI
jgi:predicted nucleic acid-binding protein